MLYRVPPLVHRLLSGPLDTFEKLEVAVGIGRAPVQTSSLGELVTVVQMPRDQIEAGVAALRELDWLDVAGGLLRLVPPAADRAAFAALLELYEDDRPLIARVVSEIAMEKIRCMAARAFAEAFVANHKKA